MNFDRDVFSESPQDKLPSYLVETIDASLNQDFVEVLPITPEDRENDNYLAINWTFEHSQIEVLYERKVISDKVPVVPKEQFIFGFKPNDGLCIFTHNETHKSMLCDSPIRELASQCFLTQSLQYILVELDEFQIWSYVPVCCSENTCPNKTRPIEMRRDLF